MAEAESAKKAEEEEAEAKRAEEEAEDKKRKDAVARAKEAERRTKDEAVKRKQKEAVARSEAQRTAVAQRRQQLHHAEPNCSGTAAARRTVNAKSSIQVVRDSLQG